jgi:hypothetical protein
VCASSSVESPRILDIIKESLKHATGVINKIQDELKPFLEELKWYSGAYQYQYHSQIGTRVCRNESSKRTIAKEDRVFTKKNLKRKKNNWKSWLKEMREKVLQIRVK